MLKEKLKGFVVGVVLTFDEDNRVLYAPPKATQIPIKKREDRERADD